MCPLKSKQQAKYMYAKKPKLAKEMAEKTPSIKALPAKVKPKKARKAPSKPKQEMHVKKKLQPIEERRKMK